MAFLISVCTQQQKLKKVKRYFDKISCQIILYNNSLIKENFTGFCDYHFEVLYYFKVVVLDVSEVEPAKKSMKAKFFAIVADTTGAISCTVYKENEKSKFIKGNGIDTDEHNDKTKLHSSY